MADTYESAPPDVAPLTDHAPHAPGCTCDAHGPRVAHLSRAELDASLAGIGPRRQAFNAAMVGALNHTSHWLRSHWLALVNGGLAAFIGVSALAPVGYALGFTGVSSAIFQVYHFACGQVPSHSFFIGGYQMCLCSRCLAIYSTMLLAGLFLAVIRRRRSVQAINWWMWILTMLPMALDGGTQLFGWRESDVWLRLLTGAIFGLGTAWFTLPQIERSAQDEVAVAQA